jgi:general secretion pathway protein H
MPTLATGIWVNSTPRRVHARLTGFSLVELMIVVFIIGLITAAAVITFGGDRRDTELDREAQRLDALLDYTREQAELQTRDYGLRMDRLGYTFVVFDPVTDQWRTVNEDDALRERKWPEDMLPGLAVEGRQVVLDTKKPTIKDFKPQVLVFANGDLSAFEVTLQRPDSQERARIYTDEQSNLLLLLPGETEPETQAMRTARTP